MWSTCTVITIVEKLQNIFKQSYWPYDNWNPTIPPLFSTVKLPHTEWSLQENSTLVFPQTQNILLWIRSWSGPVQQESLESQDIKLSVLDWMGFI